MTSLSCGRLKKASADGGPLGDVLCVGTPSSLQVYDVANNADLFYKEVGIGRRAAPGVRRTSGWGRTPAPAELKV